MCYNFKDLAHVIWLLHRTFKVLRAHIKFVLAIHRRGTKAARINQLLWVKKTACQEVQDENIFISADFNAICFEDTSKPEYRPAVRKLVKKKRECDASNMENARSLA